MNERRKKAVKQILLGVVLLLLAGEMYWFGRTPAKEISNFFECAEAGNPVMESYPRQCRDTEGTTFRENIGNELEKDNVIRIAEPRPNGEVASPLVVNGVARGNWFFEGSFPIVVADWDGKIIGEGYVTAQEDSMTEEFVPFSGTVEFNTSEIQGNYSNRGTLILKKDNPSALPENDDALEIPLVFSKVTTSEVAKCFVTGCSGQICSDEEVMTTCEYKERYACYKQATCERKSTGQCGWTETETLRQCLHTTP